MKYGNKDYPILYHGTEATGLVGILQGKKLAPIAEQKREQLREDSVFAREDYNSIVRLLEAPPVLITPVGGKRSIKQILEGEGIELTQANYGQLRDQLIELEIQEGMRGIRESRERERYEHVWLTHEKRVAKTYAPKGIILGMEIPKSIEKRANFRYYGQIGFPCSIGLENLKEVTYWDLSNRQLGKLKKDFQEWNPLFVEYARDR